MTLITRSDALPDHLKKEMAAMGDALTRKYGPAAHVVGTMLENLAGICAVVRDATLTPEQRIQASDQAKEACADVINLIGAALKVDRASVLAVAAAYRELARRIEEELLGADVVLRDTESAAAEAIAKARMH